jgi:tyrosyl-tRNA synthetase
MTLNRKLNNIDEDAPFSKDVYGLTCPLLMTKDGKKMGKTEQGTLWVARDRTTPYDFYQYFYNVGDENTEPLLRLFTRKPLAEITEICEGDILAAKRIMAYEITKLVHGKDEADKAQDAAKSLFGGAQNTDNAPSYTLTDFTLSAALTEIMAFSGMCSSKGDARRMILQGAVSVNGEKISDINHTVTAADFPGGSMLLRKGKKEFLKIKLQ